VRRRARPSLPTCEVVTDRLKAFGVLFFTNNEVVIILNHINALADLRPKWRPRVNRIQPEANVLILPRHDVREIRLYRPLRPRGRQ
jgi:hypothetical protein